MRMNRKLLIFQIVWFIAFILSLRFYRFEFGFFKTGAVFLIIGILGAWLLSDRREKIPIRTTGRDDQDDGFGFRSEGCSSANTNH